MEGFFGALASLSVIIVIIGILAAITPYLFMYFMYKQMKQLQKKMDDLIKNTGYLCKCEQDKKQDAENKPTAEIKETP